MAIWKVIEGFSNYSVSSDGIVKNNRTGNRIHLYLPKKKGLRAAIRCVMNDDSGKRTSVRLKDIVIKAFHGPAEGTKIQVDYIDGNPLNCKPSNLRYVTAKEYRKRYNISYERNDYIERRNAKQEREMQSSFLTMKW